MKSAVFYGKHNLKIEERQLPKMGDHDVLIQVKACGVCGTDIHIYEGDEGAAEVTPPTILGHEFSGVVAEVGRHVKSVQKGDRVTVDPNCYCGSCEACRRGIAHYCSNMIGYGTTVDGGFSEYCSVHEQQIYQLGVNTTFEQGAMAEPAACCIHGIDMCEITPGASVVVIGGGMIGLLMVQLAKIAGAAKVALLEPLEAKREVGKKMGADIVINPLEENVEEVLKRNGMHWVQSVIECVGKPSTIELAIQIVGSKGVVMMFGLTKPEEMVAIKPFQVFKKELALKASYINPYTQQRALDLIDSGKLDVSSMIYEICGFEKLGLILSDSTIREKGKYIISPNL